MSTEEEDLLYSRIEELIEEGEEFDWFNSKFLLDLKDQIDNNRTLSIKQKASIDRIEEAFERSAAKEKKMKALKMLRGKTRNIY